MSKKFRADAPSTGDKFIGAMILVFGSALVIFMIIGMAHGYIQ